MATRTIFPQYRPVDVATGSTEKAERIYPEKALGGVHLPSEDTSFAPGALLECPFNHLRCYKKYACSSTHEWYVHSLQHFGTTKPPCSNRCCFCDATFESPDGFQSWHQRMEHISLHQRSGQTLLRARPDFQLYTFLWRRKLINDLQYNSIKGSLAGSMTGSPLSPRSTAHFSASDDISQPSNRVISEGLGDRHSGSFEPTVVHQKLRSSDGNSCCPLVEVELAGMFLRTDNEELSCYRRNLFNVHCSFYFERGCRLPFFLASDDDHHPKEIIRFHLSLSGATDAGDPVKLLKIPPKTEGNRIANLSPIPILTGSGAPSSTVENPVSEPHISTFEPHVASDMSRNPFIAEFNRMQFQTATANNGRRKEPLQYHRILVNLSVETFPKTKSLVLIASKTSCPLFVRGRLPSNSSSAPIRSPVGNLHNTNASDEALVSSAKMSETLRNFESLVETSLPLSRDQEAASKEAFDPHPSAESTVPENRVEQFTVSDVKSELPLETAKHSLEHCGADPTINEVSNDCSISSAAFSSRSLVSSRSYVAFETWTEFRLVDLLLEDKGFKALCIDGFTSIDPDRFERNLRRLLKVFLKNVRLQLDPALQKVFVKYRHSRAKDVASALRKRFAIITGREKQDRKNINTIEVVKPQIFQWYRNESSVHQEITNTFWEQQMANRSLKDPESGSSSSDDFFDDQAKPEFVTLNQSLTGIILNSNAWEDLREGLMGFVVPVLVSEHHSSFHTIVEREIRETGRDYQDLPRDHPMFKAIHAALFLDDSLKRAYTEIELFSQSLRRIEESIASPYDGIEQETLLSAKLGAVEAEFENLYTSCVQGRFQQSYEHELVGITALCNISSTNGTGR
ncbi:MAG: hypothetical protein Q9170_007374 [Blastenia crenularia]